MRDARSARNLRRAKRRGAIVATGHPWRAAWGARRSRRRPRAAPGPLSGRRSRRLLARSSRLARGFPGDVGELPLAIDRAAVDDPEGFRLARAPHAADQLTEA